MSRTVVATFRSYPEAEQAAKQVRDQGLRTDDISIVTKQSDETGYGTGTTATMMDTNNDTVTAVTRVKNDNISDGVVTGGLLGGLAGLLIGAGSMIIPGLGAIAAAGPITGLLSGAVTGGIVGGLVDLGIPEERSKEYEADVKQGKVLFSMKAEDANVQKISTILRSNSALSVDTY